jgi:hypothetical protein
MVGDAALVLPLLRDRRDYLDRTIDNERAVNADPNYPSLPWLDRDVLIAQLVGELAQLNAAIARRLPNVGKQQSTGSEVRRRSPTYWQSVSLYTDASKDALRSWFSPLADDMTPYKAEILCDADTDRVNKLRAFMTDKSGKHYRFIRTTGRRYTISMEPLTDGR